MIVRDHTHSYHPLFWLLQQWLQRNIGERKCKHRCQKSSVGISCQLLQRVPRTLTNQLKNKNKNKSGLFSCPDRILDYFSDILFTFSTTFILITKLKSLSVLNLSVRLSVCLSVFLSFYYLSDIQLTF